METTFGVVVNPLERFAAEHTTPPPPQAYVAGRY